MRNTRGCGMVLPRYERLESRRCDQEGAHEGSTKKSHNPLRGGGSHEDPPMEGPHGHLGLQVTSCSWEILCQSRENV